MGKCTFCGESAGLFRSGHSECRHKAWLEEQRERQERSDREAYISNSVEAFLKGGGDIGSIRTEIENLPHSKEVKTQNLVSTALASYLKSNFVGPIQVPTAEAEDRITALVEAFDIQDPSRIDNRRTWIRFVMLCTLSDMDKGKFPRRATINGDLPFIFDKNERIAWAFTGVEYLADKVVRSRSNPIYGGVSMRVIRGVYMHAGAPIGQTVTSQGFVLQDTGLLVVTDRALYFRGQHKSLKMKLSTIVTFSAFNEGFSFCKGGTSARDQAFVTGDGEGWFSFMLTKCLAEAGAALK